MNKTSFDEKMVRLMELSGPEWTFKQHRAAKGARIWEIAGTYIRNLSGNFFRMAMVDTFVDGQIHHTQAIALEESDSFNWHDCNKVHGRVILPVRERDGVLEVGFSCQRSVGSYGVPVIRAPRCSKSNIVQLPEFSGDKVLYTSKVRLNANRLTGFIQLQVVKDDSLEQMPGEVVWFSLDEVITLLEDTRFCDSPTRELTLWVLAAWGLKYGASLAK